MENRIGINFLVSGWHLRPTELSAAIGLSQIKKVDSWVKKRQAIWFYLNQQLQDVKGVKVPEVPDYAEPSCNWWGAVINHEEVGAESMNNYLTRLNKEGAFTKVLCPEPVYMTKVFQKEIHFYLTNYPNILKDYVQYAKN